MMKTNRALLLLAAFLLAQAFLPKGAGAQDPPPFRHADVAGRWTITQTSSDGTRRTGTLQLTQNGDRFNGTIRLSGNIRGTVEGGVAATTVTFKAKFTNGVEGIYHGELSFDGKRIEQGRMDLRRGDQSDEGQWSAAR